MGYYVFSSRGQPINNGLELGDALSPLLFNIALEKCIRSARHKSKMFAFDGTNLVLSYADDIDVIDLNILSIKRTFENLEKEAQNMGLRINETKTKYMHMSRRPRRYLQSSVVGSYAFEEVGEFKYLGALVSAQSTTSDDVRA